MNMLEVMGYYNTLLRNDRLIPVLDSNNKVIGAFSFYILNSENKYLHSENFKVIEEDIDGNICFIDHLFSDRLQNYNKISYGIRRNIIKMIRDKFPSVEFIKWCRYKDGHRFIFSKYMGGK